MAHGQLARLLSWSHRGFNLDAGQAHLAANDAPGRRRLAEYLLRAPFSLEKITYNPATASVPYRSTPHWPTRRTFEVWTAPNFIATLLAHLPTKGSPQVRYYGWYSNKSRGLRTSAAQASTLAAAQASASAATATADPTATATADPTTDPATPATTDAPAVPFAAPHPPPRRRRRIAWRELIKHVWGVDPLKCPLCPDQLRPIAVVKKTTEIATLLAALNLPRPHQHPWAHGPPAPTGTVVVDARTGTAYPVDPRPDPADLLYPKIYDESLRCRAAVMDPRDDFDQTGCAWPSAPVDPADAPGQAELFADNYSQPDAAASEPVFWTEPTRPADQRHPSADADPADPTAGGGPADALESS